MRILLDECVHERFRNFFPGHDCQTTRFVGFAGLKNGALLTAAESSVRGARREPSIESWFSDPAEW
jgi:hypothetical protein